jgi:glycerol 2-dehydrogenase (NADP+)
MTTQLTSSTAEVTLNTGAKIPQLGLGTWRSTEEEAYNAVLNALKLGYRHIDSAAIYGNERQVGKAIKDSGVPREEIFVTTKLWGTQHKHPKEALDQSLERLGLDYVDLYLIHWPVAFKDEGLSTENDFLSVPQYEDGSRKVDIEDWDFVKTWELVQQLPKEKAKAVGVSNFSVKNLQKLLDAPSTKVIPAANQVETHPLLPQNELIEFGKKHGIVLEAYSPLGSQDSPLFTNETLKAIADEYSVSIPQLLINWALKRGYVVLPKSINADRIAANFKVFDLKEEDFTKVTDLIKKEGEQRFIVPDWSPFPTFE